MSATVATTRLQGAAVGLRDNFLSIFYAFSCYGQYDGQHELMFSGRG